jgi:hypothetical protein
MDRNMANAKEVTAREAADKDHAQARDTAHDGRVIVGRDVSVGGRLEPGKAGAPVGGASVNVKVHDPR